MDSLKLYRGFETPIVTGVDHENWYLEFPRRPRDTSIEIHREADDWFYNTFGFRFRSESLCCTGNLITARCYGKGMAKIIEPIGEHCCCWSPQVEDFYIDIECAPFPHGATLVEVLAQKEYETFTLSDDEKMRTALKSNNEIMLWCKKYRVFDV